jgi:hypothetical protein
MTCPRSHSLTVAEVHLEPRALTPCSANCLLCHIPAELREQEYSGTCSKKV